MSTPTLVVMAAGVGSRYGGLKQLEPVGPSGESILDYSIFDALRTGFGKVVFVIRKELQEAFQEKVDSTIGKRCEIAFAYQKLEDVPGGVEIPAARKKPWGTAHAVLSCRDVVHSSFAVINADDFYGPASYRTLFEYLENAQDGHRGTDWCMVGYRLKSTLSEHGSVTRGVCAVNSEGFLERIREHKRIERVGPIIKYTQDGQTWIEIPQSSIVSMNMWGFTHCLFSKLQAGFLEFLEFHRSDLKEVEFFLPDVVGCLIEKQQATVRVLPTDEQWLGITYRQDTNRVRAAIARLVQQGVYPKNLWHQKS